jgi:hypothetical protein
MTPSNVGTMVVHRAIICYPDALPDKRTVGAARSHFGYTPLLVIGVSSPLYRRFGETDHEHPMRLVVRGATERSVLVALLQFGGHQLRCVMSLRRPLVQQMLRTMKRKGTYPVVLLDVENDRFAGLECDVPAEDVDAVLRPGLPKPSNSPRFRGELSYVALSCLLVQEVPSIVNGEEVRYVDVALVGDSGFTDMPLET